MLYLIILVACTGAFVPHVLYLSNCYFLSLAKESSVPLNKNASPTREVEPPPVADNPYEKFVAEQNARELQLDAERTAKRARPQAERAEVINQKEGRLPLETDQGAKRAKLNAELPDIAVLRQELEAKTEECQRLRIRLNEREREMSFQENFTMVCTITCNFKWFYLP